MNVKRQRLVVWSVLLVTVVASMAFNVIGTALATDSIPALVMSLVWSVLALGSVDILVKVKTPTSRKRAVRRAWLVAKFGGAGFVALVSMITSYDHAYITLMSWNQGIVTSMAGPIAIDGGMIFCGVMLLALPATRTRRTTKSKRSNVRKLKAA